MNIEKLLAILIFLMAGPGLVWAQSTPDPNNKPNVFFGSTPKVDKSRLRDLKGLVKDDAEKPVEGAIVLLKDLKTGKVVEFVTKPDGAFLFYDLNMDLDYELTAKGDGFTAPVKKKLSKYDSRKPAVLNFELERKKPSG
jgi:hypothetical protein